MYHRKCLKMYKYNITKQVPSVGMMDSVYLIYLPQFVH